MSAHLIARIKTFKETGAAYITTAREIALECFEHVQAHSDWNMFTLFADALNSEGYKEAFMNWTQTFSPTYFYQKGNQWLAVKNKLADAPDWQPAAAKATPFDTFERKAEPKVLDLDVIKGRIAAMLKSVEKKILDAKKGKEGIVKEDDIPAMEAFTQRMRETLADVIEPGEGNVTAKEEIADMAKDAKAKGKTSKAKSQTFSGALSDAGQTAH